MEDFLKLVQFITSYQAENLIFVNIDYKQKKIHFMVKEFSYMEFTNYMDENGSIRESESGDESIQMKYDNVDHYISEITRY